MDLTQRKLTKAEWESLEVPLPNNEVKILKMILNSFDNVNSKYNDTYSLNKYMKVTTNFELYDIYFYNSYFKKIIDNIRIKYGLKNIVLEIKKIKKKLKTRDLIRIKNFEKRINTIKMNLYEYILLDLCETYLKSNTKEKPKWYYTLTKLVKNDISNINSYVFDFVQKLLGHFKNKMEKLKNILIENAEDYIEKNTLLSKYSNLELYTHQKEVFTVSKTDNPVCILYQAPTGTGKTLSPIGLSKKYKIIFVCAAKHVGLQLAKACISMQLKVAIAFGCKGSDDIRLHYYAVKEFIKNRRTGGIFRVDNTNGENVEIIISDIQSYLHSMRYMLAFNDKENILWYWDEPTITLDYEEHDFHKILQDNWQNNEIPNIILSSATLPNKEDVLPMVYGFKNRFENCEVHEIVSYDCKKTISIIDTNGFVVMPHLLADNNKKKLKRYARYIKNNKTLLRHVDVKEMSRFLVYLNKKELIKSIYKINNYFENIDDIDIVSIKLYYLKLISSLKEMDETLWKTYKSKLNKQYKSSIKITTTDAYTLTDGPTIFLTENVEKLAMFYLKASKIPFTELTKIIDIITENEVYKKELEKITMVEEERQIKADSKKEKDLVMGSREEQEILIFERKVSALKAKIKPINLRKVYIPNTEQHINNLHNLNSVNNITKRRIGRAFTSEIDDEVVEKIMVLNIKDEWKILLLMGIGVFADDNCKEYKDIMKKLAQEQKLYLILASSDYIYGTNYQFCHGYLAKDLANMTQEKMLQAFGRVGRKNNQLEYTLRLRDISLIEKLYTKEEDKKEIYNMNRLFG
jgi:hypothetical protein